MPCAACFPRPLWRTPLRPREAGLGFEVQDGRAGFPADLIDASDLPAQIDIVDGRLRLRSDGAAQCYLGAVSTALKSPDGFVDTGDSLELRDGRYRFVGRSDGVINVGGHKVHPEEVEAVINSLSGVQGSRVAARKNPITGAVVTAEVVRSADGACRGELPNEDLKLLIIAACAMLWQRISAGFNPLCTNPGSRAVRQADARQCVMVIVTGGSRGIGLAICLALVAEGYQVIAVARSETAQLLAAMKAAADSGTGRLNFRACDLSRTSELARFVGRASEGVRTCVRVDQQRRHRHCRSLEA